MRVNRDGIFVIVLMLALIASTSVAVIAATGASLHTKVITQSGGGTVTGGTSGTSGTSGSNGTGGTAGGGGGTASGGSSGGSGSGGSAGGAGSNSGGANQEQGVTSDSITVGGIFSESNGLDAHVEEDTVRACFDMYNAQGGVNGRQLLLVSYDDGMEQNQAYSEAVRLDQQDHIFAVVGWLAPFGESSAAPYFEQQGIPIVGGLGVPQEFNSPDSFPVSPIFPVDGYALGYYATNPQGPLHLKHPGVILVQTSGIDEVASGIVQGAAKNGVSINSNDIVTVPFAEPNFDSIILQFRSQGVDGLITQLDPFSYVRLYSSMESNGGVYPHLAGAGIDKQSVDAAIGKSLDGVYSFMPYLEAQGNPGGDNEVALYNATLAKYYPSQVQNQDAFSEGSWVACRVFVQALQSLGRNVTHAGLVHALDSETFQFGNMVSPLNFGAAGASHAANHCASYITYTPNSTWSIAQPFTCY